MKISKLFGVILSQHISLNHGLDLIEATRGLACPKNARCATKNSCPLWSERDAKLNQLPNNSDERRALIEEYKSEICNKADRGLCCPVESQLDLVEESDKSCPSISECATRDSCKFWKDKSDSLGRMRRGTTEYEDLRNEIVSQICNKASKALCCPKVINPINDSPTYLPVLGECGTNPHKTPQRVFGGITTQAGDFPFAVLLGQAVRKQTNRYVGGERVPAKLVPKWVCGGTLINYWYVVAAAHCTAKLAYLRLGEWKVGGSSENTQDKLPPVQDFRIRQENIIIHEEYKVKFGQYLNDIALIRLPRKPKLNLGVQFACLPHPEAAPRVGVENWETGVERRRATVIGWGYSCYENNSRSFCKSENAGPRDQQFLEVPVVSNRACKEYHDVSEKQVCAGGELGKGSCQEDSGGGLFIRKDMTGATSDESPWHLLGIVSYGPPACGRGVPGVYTRVSKYVNWIENKISK